MNPFTTTMSCVLKYEELVPSHRALEQSDFDCFFFFLGAEDGIQGLQLTSQALDTELHCSASQVSSSVAGISINAGEAQPATTLLTGVRGSDARTCCSVLSSLLLSSRILHALSYYSPSPVPGPLAPTESHHTGSTERILSARVLKDKKSHEKGQLFLSVAQFPHRHCTFDLQGCYEY